MSSLNYLSTNLIPAKLKSKSYFLIEWIICLHSSLRWPWRHPYPSTTHTCNKWCSRPGTQESNSKWFWWCQTSTPSRFNKHSHQPSIWKEVLPYHSQNPSKFRNYINLDNLRHAPQYQCHRFRFPKKPWNSPKYRKTHLQSLAKNIKRNLFLNSNQMRRSVMNKHKGYWECYNILIREEKVFSGRRTKHKSSRGPINSTMGDGKASSNISKVEMYPNVARNFEKSWRIR